MSDKKKSEIDTWKQAGNSFMAAAGATPFWFWMYNKSLEQRRQLLQPTQVFANSNHSKKSSRHINFFSNIISNSKNIKVAPIMWPLYPTTEWLIGTTLEKIEHIHKRHPTIAEKLFTGFFAGFSTALVTNPYETMLLAMQKQNSSPFKAVMDVIKHSGVKGLYASALCMASKNGLFASCMLVATPEFKKLLENKISKKGKAHHFITTVLAPVIPATIFNILLTPAQITYIMRQAEPSKHMSNIEALKKAYLLRGLSAFKVGTALSLLCTATEFALYGEFKNYLDTGKSRFQKN